MHSKTVLDKSDWQYYSVSLLATETFWNTVVICAITGIVVVSSIMSNPAATEGLKGAVLTKVAFAQIPVISLLLLSGVIVAETKKYLWEDKLDKVSTDPIRLIGK